MKAFLIITVITLVAWTPANKIGTYQTDAAQSTLTIAGTSTLHDWEMEAVNMNGAMDVDLYEDRLDIKSIKLTVKVESLKSGKSPMDNNAYKALKYKDHPNIKYEFTNLKSINKISSKKFKLITTGKMHIAGKTRTMDIPVEADIINGSLNLSGSVPMKMTDFGVEPPSFMFGSVTTGDEITVKFKINYKSIQK